MFNIKEDNVQHNYKVFDGQYIKDNYIDILEETDLIYRRFCHKFPNTSSTAAYAWYGIQSFTLGLTHYYYILQSLERTIRNFVNHDKPIWYQCWINFHDQNQLLDWHDHINSSYHGYLSIDPKDSYTLFENYTIDNQIGQLYIGPTKRLHKVVAKPFLGKRVTLGFDITNGDDVKSIYKDFGEIDTNLGFVKID